MAKKQTFAQYLINNILPKGIEITGPMTKKEFQRVLTETFRNHEQDYARVVMDLKNLGDKLSTLEGISIGMEDIDVPNKSTRDRLISTAIKEHAAAKTQDQKIKILEKVQDAVAKNDLSNGDSNATMMITSGAMGGKKGQLMKLRSSPVVLKNHKGELVPDMVTKSYAEGLGVLDYWHGAMEARANLVEGRVATSEPGVFNKVTHNLMSEMVISGDDCGTRHGIQLNTKDESIIDRYLAQKAGRYPRNTLVTTDVQQALLRQGIDNVIVRSPQTCEADHNTVCSKCYGLSIAHKRLHKVGDNVGALSAGSLSEVSQQLVLSSKHSTTLAKTQNDLEGRKGLNMATEIPKIYPNKEILCELYGEIYRIFMAPQGGRYIQIRETQKVPDRYIVEAKLVPKMGRLWQYYIPPQRKILDGIKEKAKVYPGMKLTDGNPNLKDIARLRSLGVARSAATELVKTVYKNTGNDLDRRHFELLGKAMMNYVKIEKAPTTFPFKRGEVVQYNKFRGAVEKITKRAIPLTNALGQVLGEDIHHLTVGTEITQATINDLKKLGIKSVKVAPDLEVSAVVAPLTRVQLNDTENWIAKLNHRNLKSTIVNAATEGQKQPLHGYNPIMSYAYGTEVGQDKKGKY